MRFRVRVFGARAGARVCVMSCACVDRGAADPSDGVVRVRRRSTCMAVTRGCVSVCAFGACVCASACVVRVCACVRHACVRVAWRIVRVRAAPAWW